MQHTDFTEANYFAVEFAVVDTKLIEEMKKKKKNKMQSEIFIGHKRSHFSNSSKNNLKHCDLTLSSMDK